MKGKFEDEVDEEFERHFYLMDEGGAQDMERNPFIGDEKKFAEVRGCDKEESHDTATSYSTY